MTKEETQLLLKDLCSRLPYKVMVYYHYCNSHGDTINEEFKELDFSDLETLQYNLEYAQYDKYDISWKPYLRPMSNMTEEERKEYAKLLFADLGGVLEDYYKSLDYLNSIHIDYRGLIERGIALEAPEGMYD